MFDTLSNGQLIFISISMFAFIWASIKMKSAISTVSWALMSITLSAVLWLDISINYFWFTYIISSSAIGVSMVIYVFYVKNI